MNMTVNSLPFLVFFTLTAVIYYLFPRLQWVVLLLASLVFYSLAGARTFLWLILTILTTYGAVRWMEAMDDQLKKRQAGELKEASHEIKKAEKARTKKKKRHVAALFIIVNIGILALLKYGNFLIDNANYVLGLFGISPVNRLGLAAPLGISYYTLQSIGYVLDVYKGKCKPEHNILKTALFVCFFPQMTQGPIGRFPDLAPQLFAVHKFSYENLSFGLQRVLWGFFKKCVIADRMKPSVDAIFRSADCSGMTLFLGCVYMAIQIYADFSGYMDIVAGFSEVLGIHLMENFKRPFLSRSLGEYWRRWHLSLSFWFRDYLFYPLSISKPAVRFGKWGKKCFGIRIGKIFPAMFALFIVWFSTGLWHDSSWKYILWGVANGVILMSSLFLEPYFQKWKAFFHIREESGAWRLFCLVRTFFLVAALKVFPGSPTTQGVFDTIRRIFTDFRPSLSFEAWFPKLVPQDLIFLAIGLTAMLAVDLVQEKQPVRALIARQHTALRWLLYLGALAGILIMGTFSISMTGGFTYAQF